MFEAIAQAASSLQHERGLRSVLLRGKGRAFCTGLDVKSIVRSNPWKATRRLLQRPSGYYQHNQQQEQQQQQSLDTTTNNEKKKHDDNTNATQNDDDLDEQQPSPLPLPALGNLAQDVGYLWRSLPVPVIAVLHGMCYGGGEFG
jgi:enoyl-CoA hydratase/carnithine racemase